jgi:ribosomal protein S18 acetylase RimI-like enzyme
MEPALDETVVTTRIRTASALDRAALEALYRRCRRLAEWLPARERAKADFASDTRDEEIVVAIARDGALDGFVSVWRPQSFVHHLYVRPEARGQGVGAALLAALVGRFPFPWRLKCVCANTRALAFYAKRGWREVDSGVGAQGRHVVLELDRHREALER